LKAEKFRGILLFLVQFFCFYLVMKIRSKILVSICSCSFIAFIGVGASIYILISQYSLEKWYETLHVRHALEKNMVENFLSEVTEKLRELSWSENNIEAIVVLSKYQNTPRHPTYRDTLTQVQKNISHFTTIYPEIENISFIDSFGIVVYANNDKDMSWKFIDTLYGKWFLERAWEHMFISDIRLRKDTDESYIFASIPVETQWFVVIELGTKTLDTLLQATTNGEKKYILSRDGLIKTPIESIPHSKFEIYNTSESFHTCFQWEKTKVIEEKYRDFQGRWVLWNVSYISEIDMCLISEIYLSNILQTSHKILLILMASCIGMFIFTTLVAGRFIKRITSPLVYLSEKISQARAGESNLDIQTEKKDEVADLAKNFQEMMQELHITDKKIQEKVDVQTEQIRAKQKETVKLNKDLRKFQEALKKASDYIAILDHTGKIIYINNSLEKETGFTLKESQWKSTKKYWRQGDSYKKMEELLEAISETHDATTQELVTTRKNGTSFISDVHVSPIISNGEVEFFVTIENDITQQKEVQKMKDEFISIVSHELRTPMTVIRGFTKLFLEEKFWSINPEQKKYLETINTNTEYLIHMVNDMLDIEKLNSGKMEFHYESCDIQDMLSRLQESLQFMCNEKNISLSYSSKKYKLTSDREKIEQVLINLIRNAFKFTAEDGKIHISATKKKTNLYIEVSDTGVGIKKEDFWKVFQKFGQVDSVLQRKQKGTWLWLSICELIVENLGGTIGFDSIYWKGSTFFFTIPFKK